MELTPRVARQIALFSMVLVIVPMVVFPEQMGTSLARASLISAIYELVFYGIVLFLFQRHQSLIGLLQGAGLCLVYRLTVGALFGLLIAAMYSMNIRVSITLGVSSYLPVILLQIAATPFVLRPLIMQAVASEKSRSAIEPEVLSTVGSPTEPALTLEKAAFKPDRSISMPATPVSTTPFYGSSEREKAIEMPPAEINGFDRATRYIAEDGGVVLAAVVDREGLLLSQFGRGGIDAEEWAPLALLMRETQAASLGRFGWREASAIRLDLDERRIVVVYEEQWALLVVADRQKSETLNIRINQALEIVGQYVSQRYDRKLFENLEISHV